MKREARYGVARSRRGILYRSRSADGPVVVVIGDRAYIATEEATKQVAVVCREKT